MYERIGICFGISLEIVWGNRTQFTSDVWIDLMEHLAIKHRFTKMYKSSTNRLVEQTNKILCSLIAKEAETRAIASDWDLKIHHAMWIYNSTFKTATGFFPFCLAYSIEILLSIEYELMTQRTASKARLDLNESQLRWLMQLNKFDEVQLRARQEIEVAHAKMQKKAKIMKRMFKMGNLMMLYNFWHFWSIHKNCFPSGLDEVNKVFASNGTHFLLNLDCTNYPDKVNHDKLKKAYVDLLD